MEREAFQHLNEAIGHVENSIATTNGEDPLLGERRLNLAKLLLRKYIITDDSHWDLEATRNFKATFETVGAPLPTRLQGAIQAGIDTHEAGNAADAYQIYQDALGLLHHLNEYSISSQDLQRTLGLVSGLATCAASIALEANRLPYEVLMCLETGRCVIAGITISAKTDMSELLTIESDLAERYDELRRQYAQASRDLAQHGDYREARERQQTVTRQLSDTESLIRQIPGWERLQLAMTEAEIINLAIKGPVIVVNATQIRCDVVVVTEAGISVVQLLNMDYDKLTKYIALFDNIGSAARRNVKKGKSKQSIGTIQDALLWLWIVAVEPIHNATPLTPSRRVWWLTTSIAGRAPFHAAGDHSPGSTNNTLSRVVSSYISSLKALRFSCTRHPTITQERKMLLVTMSTNPSPHRDLETSYEETAIAKTFANAKTHIAHPTPKDVLNLLPSFPCVHFACHGASIAYDPSQSGLLHTEWTSRNADHRRPREGRLEGRRHGVPLRVLHSRAARWQADEAIHLANSFQALGFQHVIDTMWGAEDRAAGEVARGFYERVFGRGKGDGEWGVAGALHEAVTEYRDKVNADFVAWGLFVHIGS